MNGNCFEVIKLGLSEHNVMFVKENIMLLIWQMAVGASGHWVDHGQFEHMNYNYWGEKV